MIGKQSPPAAESDASMTPPGATVLLDPEAPADRREGRGWKALWKRAQWASTTMWSRRPSV